MCETLWKVLCGAWWLLWDTLNCVELDCFPGCHIFHSMVCWLKNVILQPEFLCLIPALLFKSSVSLTNNINTRILSFLMFNMGTIIVCFHRIIVRIKWVNTHKRYKSVPGKISRTVRSPRTVTLREQLGELVSGGDWEAALGWRQILGKIFFFFCFFFNMGASFTVSSVYENSLCWIPMIFAICIILLKVFLGIRKNCWEIFGPPKAEDVVGSEPISLRRKWKLQLLSGVKME